MIALAMFVFKLFGFAEEALALGNAVAAKKRAQGVADAPTTAQERTDAANKGEL